MGAQDERQRAIFRRRRAVAGALLLVFVIAVWTQLGGGGHRRSSSGHAAAIKPPPPHAQESAIDRVLGYTDYIEAGTRRRREVALTFDDGPSPWTPKLVKVLRRRNVPATFFPVGYGIQRYGRYLQLLRRDGFVVGDHTMTHPVLQRFDIAAQAKEIDGQATLVAGAGLPYPRLFRPPYGSFDQGTRGLLTERQMLMVLWSVNPQDYYRPGAKTIVSRTLANMHPGAIVLMHDGGGDRSQTVAAVNVLIRKLRARGYRFVTVPRLLVDDPPPRRQGPPPNLAGI
ncbi:MAG: peptidoglycan-N-acetylglucosamine deacetylase [Thermoleophilaceae bacterium]|nr:peptidoglycan-N-acetylglucosamine deacetylase [Thermoleophilaceae bacterium]